MDSTQWEALRGLAELGAKFDPTNLFDLDIDTAFDILNGGPSLNKLPTSAKDGNIQNARTKQNQPQVANKENMKSKGSQILLSNRPPIITVPENRRFVSALAERAFSPGGTVDDNGVSEQGRTSSTIHSQHTTPRTAIALGMSSLSLRMPFASPGSAPSPVEPHINSEQVAAAAFRRSWSSNKSSINGSERMARTLFDTPGLTPIGGPSHSLSHDQSLDSSINQTKHSVSFEEGPSIL